MRLEHEDILLHGPIIIMIIHYHVNIPSVDHKEPLPYTTDMIVFYTDTVVSDHQVVILWSPHDNLHWDMIP